MRFETRTPLAALACALAILILPSCGSGTDAETTSEASGELDPDAKAAVPIEEVPAASEREPLLEPGDKVVVAGDSLGIAGSPRPYPDRLAGELGGDLDVINLSEPGTTTRDWLPGRSPFKEELAPALPGADMLLITLGGNDLESALGAASGPTGLEAAQSPEGSARVLKEFEAISRRLEKIITAARKGNEGLRVAFVSYPDYSRARAYQEGRNQLEILAFRTALARLNQAATRAKPDVLIDLLTKTSEQNVNRLLADDEHLSDAGHALYAKTIVAVLGGSGSE